MTGLRGWVLAVVLGATPGMAGIAQMTVAGAAFEVASIRPTAATDGHIHIWSSPADGNFRAANVSVTDLLEFAYALPDSRFVAMGEAKGLLRAPRYDLTAKSNTAVDERLHGLPTEAAKEEKRKMVRALLAERFGLKTHNEDRELPIYTLVVGKRGPLFTESHANGTSYSMGRGYLTIEGGDATVEKMADNLANVVGRPVVDGTGIKGRYLMKLRWMPDEGGAPADADAGLPSIFTAVEEQLGLKLVAGKGPVSVLVVDHVALPSEN